MPHNYPNTYRHPLPNGLYYDMVRVRPGLFVMGNEGAEADNDERSEHLVRITQNYYIGVYPVTQAVWKSVIGEFRNPSRFKGDNRPVEQIHFPDIQGYTEQGKEWEGSFLFQLNNRYPLAESRLEGYAFRLPREAEWEYAAKDGHHRALNEAKVAYIESSHYTPFSGSCRLKGVGWYAQNSHQETKAVGSLQPNELGLYDMSGNVWEVCQGGFFNNCYKGCKQEGIVEDPKGNGTMSFDILRGGSWLEKPRSCRVSSRGTVTNFRRTDDIGFRLVLAPSSVKAKPSYGA